MAEIQTNKTTMQSNGHLWKKGGVMVTKIEDCSFDQTILVRVEEFRGLLVWSNDFRLIMTIVRRLRIYIYLKYKGNCCCSYELLKPNTIITFPAIFSLFYYYFVIIRKSNFDAILNFGAQLLKCILGKWMNYYLIIYKVKNTNHLLIQSGLIYEMHLTWKQKYHFLSV